MGMAASQARLLSLQARMSNVEYQGQQINQERTILSQQCTDLYNSLLTINVPTPPSTSDFTTVVYTAKDGSSTFTLGTVKPQGENYIVEISSTKVGPNLSSNYGTAVVTPYDGEDFEYTPMIPGKTYTAGQEVPSNLPEGAYYKNSSGEVFENGDENVTTTKDGKRVVAEGYTLYVPDPSSTGKIPAKSKKNIEIKSGVQIAGKPAFDWNDAMEYAEAIGLNCDFAKYQEAIKNTFAKSENSDNGIDTGDFYVYFETSEEGVTTPKFALINDVKSNDKLTETYSYIPNGTYTDSQIHEGCKLEFDSTGRISKIGIPVVDQGSGEILSYRNFELTASTTTDEKAYQDAYNKYQYAMYEYDKAQQEINAKTEIIQKDDKNLELKLQRLDNERTMLKTEYEACKTVVKDNIDKTFKTFSG